MKTLLERFRMVKEYIDKNANPYFKYSWGKSWAFFLEGSAYFFLFCMMWAI